MAQPTNTQNVRLLIQTIALALPAIALLLQYSLQNQERIEEQYLSDEGYVTPAGKLRRTRRDVDRQQWAGLLFTISLLPLTISGISLLLYLLLFPIIGNILQQSLVTAGIIFILIFFVNVMVATFYSGGGMVIKTIKFLLGRLHHPKMEQSNISDFFNSNE